MPTYEYVCEACHHELELFQRMSDHAIRKCPACGKLKLRRLMGMGAGIIFKGSGFYETDYKRKSGSNGTASSCGMKSSAETGSAKSSAETESTKSSAQTGSSKSAAETGSSKSETGGSGTKKAGKDGSEGGKS
jgi:putative FmdB family regulatory protein